MLVVLTSNSIVRADDADGIWGTDTGNTSTSGNANSENVTPANTNIENTSTSGNTNTADDWGLNDDGFENAITENTTANNTSNNTANNISNNVVDNTFNVSNNTTSNNTTTTSNSNSLAKTGIEDSKGIVSVIIVISGIVAIYSFKKIREYNNM